ncbi:MAG: hypothetical protein HUU29_03955, partial [Planctomycetaceae bacterium]|nr:hypothetical protein [Planctomycetaceae bacterium]
VLERAGNWYTFGDVKLGNGKPKVMEALRSPEQRELFQKIDQAVKEQIFKRDEQKEDVDEAVAVA